MICKVCGYESNENFSVCPYCENKIFSQNQSNYRSSAIRNNKGYSANMPDYFRDFGCSFKINQNELRISRFLNGGEFTVCSLVIGIIYFLLWIFAIFFFLITLTKKHLNL